MLGTRLLAFVARRPRIVVGLTLLVLASLAADPAAAENCPYPPDYKC